MDPDSMRWKSSSLIALSTPNSPISPDCWMWQLIFPSLHSCLPSEFSTSSCPNLLHLLLQHGEEPCPSTPVNTFFSTTWYNPVPENECLLWNTYWLGNESAKKHSYELVSILNWITVPALLDLLASVSPHVKRDVLIKWVSTCKHLSVVTSEIYSISKESLYITYHKDAQSLTDVRLTCWSQPAAYFYIWTTLNYLYFFFCGCFCAIMAEQTGCNIDKMTSKT